MMRLAFGILVMTLALLTQGFPQGASGHVRGEVWNKSFVERENSFENVSVPNCEVVFRSSSSPKKVVTSGDGHFELDLPAGVYNATTRCAATPNAPEYHAAVRSDFEVKPGSNALVNLMTLLKRTQKGKNRDGQDQLEYKSVDLKSESLQVKSASGESRKILVRFFRRAASKELAEYHGRRDYRQDAPASVSYDSIAIYADSITIEKPALHVQANGHVVIEDGKQRRSGNDVTIEFDAPDPITTLKVK